jgi:hypothetical protein
MDFFMRPYERGGSMTSQGFTRIGGLLCFSEENVENIQDCARYAEQVGVPDIFIRPDAGMSCGSIVDAIRAVRNAAALPITVEFDSASVSQAYACVEAGADRIVISTSALCDPYILRRLADQIGRSAVGIAVDIQRIDGRNTLLTSSGLPTGLPPLSWLGRAFQLGADGILLRGEGSENTKLISLISREFPATLGTTVESISPRWCATLAHSGCSEIHVNVGIENIQRLDQWNTCIDRYLAALPSEEISTV